MEAQPLGLRVTTPPPLVAGERVFVLGVDRTGCMHSMLRKAAKLWSLRRPGDPLTLSQAGVIAAFKDTLLVGQGPLACRFGSAERKCAVGGCCRIPTWHQ